MDFPIFSGIRVMMLPFLLDDLDSIPDEIEHWRFAIDQMISASAVNSGVAYLTIDEANVKAGETHRRPGMHVDGCGAWGGGGSWARNGMLVAASREGCRGWAQTFEGHPGSHGSCEHMRVQCGSATRMRANRIYWCSPFAVHEAVPMSENTQRQFVRLSMPNNSPWFEGYTENPKGIRPTGPILPPRDEFMSFRTSV